MRLNSQKQGEFFIFGSALLWGLFPVITVLSYHTLSPFMTLAVSNVFAALFFAILISQKKKWHELTNRKAYKNILLTTAITGILYYILVFQGLRFTTPGNVSIVAESEVFFSFFFFHVMRKEHLPLPHIIGSIFMVMGVGFILLPSITTLHRGDLLVLLASAIAPFGNFYSQKARKLVASETIMLFRSVISCIVIFGLATVFGNPLSLHSIQQSFFFLIINGVLLLGLAKILWIDGIHRISIPKANALGSLSAMFTLLFAWFILKQSPTFWQLVALVPIFIGINLLSRQVKNAPVLEESP